MRRLAALLLSLAGAALDVVAINAATGGPLGVVLALPLHGVAVLATSWAAPLRRAKLAPVERQVAVLSAAVVPVFGPLMGAWLPWSRPAEEIRSARELLDRYAEFVHYEEPPYKRSFFRGEPRHDVAYASRAECHAAVLREGGTEQKRNALRRLAELGQPAQLALVRRCLTDPDAEVRLLAYGEIERLEARLFEPLQRAWEAAQQSPGDLQAQAAMAESHRRLAASGLLDPPVADWHAREAARLRSELSGAVVTRAAPADHALERPAAHPLPSSDDVGRAVEAFRARDFETVRRIAREITERTGESPAWGQALGVPDLEVSA